jgi:NTE family protein
MKKLGLALSGGGARGFSHIGVIKALMENKIPIDYIAGTSMGAVIAAYYALHKDMTGLEMIVSDFNKGDMLTILDMNDPRRSIVKGEKARAFMKKLFGDKTFDNTKIPLGIGATSLQTGKEVMFSSGKILDAVMASGAYPVVFPPVKFNGEDLVDGGLAEAIPVEMVKNMGAEVIIAVDLFSVKPQTERNFDDIINVLERTMELLLAKLSDYDIKKYGKNILVLKPETGNRLQTFSFYNGKDKILAGYAEAEKHMKLIKKLVK